ncbi:MAG: four helix bundle protein [Bacteroidota bacterium]
MTHKISSFKDLEDWKHSHELVLSLYSISSGFPKNEEFRITNQLLRAGISIPTNIAEGAGRFSNKEYIHFLVIARGSVEEVKYLVFLAKELHYIPEEKYLELDLGINQIGKMLNGLICSLRNQPPTPNPQPHENN